MKHILLALLALAASAGLALGQGTVPRRDPAQEKPIDAYCAKLDKELQPKKQKPREFARLVGKGYQEILTDKEVIDNTGGEGYSIDFVWSRQDGAIILHTYDESGSGDIQTYTDYWFRPDGTLARYKSGVVSIYDLTRYGQDTDGCVTLRYYSEKGDLISERSYFGYGRKKVKQSGCSPNDYGRWLNMQDEPWYKLIHSEPAQ